MKLNKDIFRMYDIRGLEDKDLPNPVVEAVGKAFGTLIQGKIVVAYDNRLSSKRIRSSLIKGILSTGCDVINIGEVPTPVYYHALANLKSSGIMITGSHNPPEFNGLKMNKKKESLFGKELQKIREIAEKERFVVRKKGSLIKKNIINDYAIYIFNKFKHLELSEKLNVIIDCGNGTASIIYPEILKRYAKLTGIYCKSDGRFPNHFPDPAVKKNLNDLIKKVKQEKADFGLAFDGEGDRLGLVDDKGRIIPGDIILLLFARELLRKKPGQKILFDVKCSQALIDDIKKHKGIPIMYKTGHSLIKSKMMKEKLLFGGEMSGHFYFSENNYFDDALFASLKLIGIISREKKPLSSILKAITKYHSSPEIRVKCSDKIKFDVVKRITRYFKKKHKVIAIDGARILFKDGWGLIRASNTQPALVLRFEGRTENALKNIKKEVLSEVNVILKKIRQNS